MNTEIVSVALIARQASAAAASWKPGHPQPPNPYDEHLQPDHFSEWERRFDLAAARATECDGEASA